jgi:Sigma-70, region 4
LKDYSECNGGVWAGDLCPERFFARFLKRIGPATHDSDVDGQSMMRSRQGKEHFFDRTSIKPGGDHDRLFQLTMLHAFLLPPRSRDVYVLTEMHGYTLPEVAKVLGISKDDAKKHLRRARREMQRM